jgi:ParB/RepB/Spo0J family partition protein
MDSGTVVKLPDGTTVSTSTMPELWWHTDGATGYISPSLLFPDPYQPRLIIGGGDWSDFVASISAVGVREHIRVTPLSHAPWLTSLDAGVHFAIVSGHRRHRAALEAGLPAVPITVKLYLNEAAHREDSDLLNTGRKDLTPFEEAVEINRRRQLGETWKVIALKRGMSTLTCQMRVHLLALAPDLQELINPVARSGVRSDFPIAVAQALGTLHATNREVLYAKLSEYDILPDVVVIDEDEGEHAFTFALQRAVLAEIQGRGLGSNQALSYIANSNRRSGGNGRVERGGIQRGQATLWRSLLSGVRTPQKSLTATMTREHIRHACQSKTIVEVTEVLEQLKKSEDELERVQTILRSILEGKERAATQPKPFARFTPTPARTKADMTPEEVARITAASLALLKNSR